MRYFSKIELKLKIRHYLLILLIIITSCVREQNKNTKAFVKRLKLEYQVDSVMLKLPVGSGIYLIQCWNNMFYILDYRFAVLSVFDSTGKYVNRFWGIGKGPSELPSQPRKFITSPNGFIVVSDFTFFEFPKLSSTYKEKSICFDDNPNINLLMTKPNGNMPGIYEVDWSFAENRISIIDTLIVLPIITYHPKLNGYMHESYYKETYPVALFNLKSGKLVKLLGKKPMVYIKKKFIPNFERVYFCSIDSSVFLSFAADSSIYEFSINNELKNIFGKSEDDLNQNYPRYENNWKEADKNLLNEEKDFSSFREMKCYSSNKIIVRRVYKGKDTNSILQFYKNQEYIGKIFVDNRFVLICVDSDNIIGYLKPNDEQLENNTVLIFKIRYNIIES